MEEILSVLTELDEFISALQLKHVKEHRCGLKELAEVQGWIVRYTHQYGGAV